MESSSNLAPGVKRNTFESYRNRALGKGKEKIASKLQEKSKELGDKLKDGVKKTGEAIKDGAKAVIDSNVSTVTNAISLGEKVASGLSNTLLKVTPTPSKNSSAGASESKEEKEESKVEAKVDEKKEEPKKDEIIKRNSLYKKHLFRNDDSEKALPPINRPAVFFVKGMEVMGMSSANDGLEQMAGAYREAEVFDWDQKEEMLHKIGRRPKDQPVILVGHSFGADTAVEIANELNNLENRFRKVNLLITLDSVGSNNDIIPQNVEKNLNYISESSFFGDEPNIARDSKKTLVHNDLRKEDHTELDNEESIQFEIVDAIDTILK